jgi:hypothetical protein
MVRVCDGRSLPQGDPNAVYMLQTFGGQAHEIWNVADPGHPSLVSRIEGMRDTHKNWWECDTGVAYLVSGAPGWRAKRMTVVCDLSDPAHPVKIRDFGLPGQEPGSTGNVPTDLHGPISTGPAGNRIYFGYGTNKGGMLQIVDREELLHGPKEPTPENLRYPEVGRLVMSPLNGAHTTFPMLKMPIAEFAHDKNAMRDIVMIVDEEIANECHEPRQMVWFADVTIEAKLVMISSYTVPEESGHFCERGGRFGSHPSNESMAPIFYKKLAFVTFFNAGVRALDVRDPYHPKERVTSSPRSPRLQTDAASRSRVRNVARPRSRATMWRPTNAATYTWSTARTLASIFSILPEMRDALRSCHKVTDGVASASPCGEAINWYQNT